MKSICHFRKFYQEKILSGENPIGRKYPPREMTDLEIENSDFDFNLYSARKLQFHQGINSLLSRLVDVKKTAV